MEQSGTRTPRKPAGARAGRKAGGYRHPVNEALMENAPAGQRIADVVTNFMGSWKFILLQTFLVAFWVGGNVYLLFNFDPYPFIFLNLAFSTQAAYAAPLILLASNRAAVRDRMTLEHAAMQTDVEERQNERLLGGMTDVLHHIEAVEERILALEQQILVLQQGITPRAPGPRAGSTAVPGQGATTADNHDGGSGAA